MFSPIDFAWIISKQKTKRSFHFASKIMITNKDIRVENVRSESLIPSKLPNNISSKCTLVSTFVYMTIPSANIPENTTPITVSSFIRELFFKNPVAKEQNKPAIKAPINNGKLSIQAIAIPGKTACEIEKISSDQPFNTRKHDKSDDGIDIKIAINKAFSINSY